MMGTSATQDGSWRVQVRLTGASSLEFRFSGLGSSSLCLRITEKTAGALWF